MIQWQMLNLVHIWWTKSNIWIINQTSIFFILIRTVIISMINYTKFTSQCWSMMQSSWSWSSINLSTQQWRDSYIYFWYIFYWYLYFIICPNSGRNMYRRKIILKCCIYITLVLMLLFFSRFCLSLLDDHDVFLFVCENVF